jgi:hypothetical protein
LSGSFADLTWKPVVDSTLNTSSTNAIQNGAVATAINTINNTISWIQWDITTIQWDITNIGWDISNMQTDITNLQNTTSWLVSDSAFSNAWDWDTTHAPSKNAIYDVLGDVETLLANL